MQYFISSCVAFAIDCSLCVSISASVMGVVVRGASVKSSGRGASSVGGVAGCGAGLFSAVVVIVREVSSGVFIKKKHRSSSYSLR